jgi:Tfp pilus assembly protein PilX
MIVALIVLVVMSVFAVSAFNNSAANLRIVGNMQARQEGITAAQDAIERTLSSAVFTTDPASVAASAVDLDIDGNGTPNYSVRISPMPECFRALPIKSIELDPTSAPDRSCMVSSVLQNAGLDSAIAAANGNSLCSNSEWNIRAAATDARSAVTVALNQGVAVRILETDASNACGL